MAMQDPNRGLDSLLHDARADPETLVHRRHCIFLLYGPYACTVRRHLVLRANGKGFVMCTYSSSRS